MTNEADRNLIPYEIIRDEGDGVLGRIQRFPDIDYGHDTLASAFRASFDVEGLIFIAGLPRSGKSFSVSNFNWHMQNNQIGKYSPGLFNSIGWEDAENLARDRGLVTTANDDPFTARELTRCNSTAKELLATSIGSYRLTTFEVPAITYDQGIGRNIGTSVIDDVTAKQTRRFKELGNYGVRGIGLVGGPLMQILMMYYRLDMKTSSSFNEGVEVAKAYGQAQPADPEIWEAMKHEGASFQQIQRIEKQLDQLLDVLERQSKIPPISQEYINHFYNFFIKRETEKVGLSPELVKDVLRREIRTAHLTLYKFGQWKIPSEHGGIFFNNPTLDNLHIPSVEVIRDRIAKNPQLQ